MERKDRGKKVQGFGIRESECLWMKAGIVAYRLCPNAYDCHSCTFDKAISSALKAGREWEGRRLSSLRERLKHDSYEDRLCRHMLAGRVAYRKCANDFDCKTCEFDQNLEDVIGLEPEGEVVLREAAGYRYPGLYYYYGGHTWARVEYGGRVRIGLDEFAAKLFGRPDGWELPEIGHRIVQSGPAFSLVRGSCRAELLSPVSGTVIAANRKSESDPALPHRNPYDTGWLLLIEPSNLKEDLAALRSGERVPEWLSDEAQRLQDLALGEYGAMAATGAVPVDDVFGSVPGIGWENLVRTFLRP